METETVVPQKRKVGSPADDRSSRAADDESDPGSAGDAQGPAKNEYENGHVTCEACGDDISFRDEATGGFTVKHWDLHRQQCPNATQHIAVAEPVLYTPEAPSEVPVPKTKRRRAKRTEGERIEYLRSDPYVAQFEAYRVLCASCDKWIRLRPNSTYCSIPWDAHRKSCLAKKSKNPSASDPRTSAFTNDPYVRKFDTERVLCRVCEGWIHLGDGDGDSTQALQTWTEHKSKCLQARAASTSSAGPAPNVPTIESVPPPSKHLMALVSSSAMVSPPLPLRSPTVNVKLSPTAPAKVSPTSFKDLNPANFPPMQESRRRNAEQRAAALKADPLIAHVEPNRVFCSVCRKWVQLRQDSSYCAYPWTQHRGKCVNRQQKREQKEAELAEYRAQMEALQHEQKRKLEEGADDSEGAESGSEGAGGETEERRRRRAERRKQRADDLRRMEERRALLDRKAAAVMCMNESDPDEDAEGELDVDMEAEEYPPRLADLGTPLGRLDFTFRSIRYLFRTTYERGDDLTIASLVTYLNAAIPADKYEDFDTTEVTKAATALHERGDVVFEGDVVRTLDD